MRNIHVFAEDTGHEKVLVPLVQRFAVQYGVSIKINIENAAGGHGKAIFTLKQYIRDLGRGRKSFSDLLIVAIDGNNVGYAVRKKEIDEATKHFQGPVICAIPEPYIERWLLLDAVAFKHVLGRGCSAPAQQKGERAFYKHLLEDAVMNAGSVPFLGGLEYAEALVNAMNLEKLERTEASLGKLLKELRSKFQEWIQKES
ncbi:MAG TPA: hypothetical protein VEV19_04680 [Ktedonobacteraceae bacterium]|nr:hypothetical protein [Ktedonobacteraceae bacterium]